MLIDGRVVSFFRDCRSGSPKYLSIDFQLPSPDNFVDESLFESADIGSSDLSSSITYFSRFSCSQGSLPIWWQLTWWLWGLPFNEVWVKSGAHLITNCITFKQNIPTWSCVQNLYMTKFRKMKSVHFRSFIELFDTWNYWIQWIDVKYHIQCGLRSAL